MKRIDVFVPTVKIVRRNRHSKSRYEYPMDRKNLNYWIKAPGPCNKPYFFYDINKSVIIINIDRGNKNLEYILPIKELILAKNWRQLVAQSLRLVRKILRHTQ